MIYVDALKVCPTATGCFRAGSCHMWADDEAELHRFARRIGLKRSWFQKHRVLDHYDLTSAKRRRAIECGAVEGRVLTFLRAKGGAT